VYGERLNRGNLRKDALERLVQGYPTHAFVIDLDEAKTLFNKVREATGIEREVAAALPGLRRQGPEPIVLDLIIAHSAKGVPVKGAQHAKQKSKRAKRSSPPSGSGRQGNVAQLRPDVDSNVAPAQKNADTGDSTTEKDFKPKGKPKRVSG
jgi:hypothetical protein